MRYYFFILLLLSNVANANLVELYRTQGIDSVQEYLEKQLTKKDYWNDYLKDKDVSKGYYESIKYVLVCEKNLNNLKVYHKEYDQFKKLFENNDILLGKNGGDKQVEGDHKTPVGTYDLTQKLEQLDPYYGPLAMVTSYPNLYDRVQKKNGSGIWIHGVPENEQREEFTRGCIALDNQEIKKIDSQIKLDESVLLISEENLKSVSREEISTILGELFKWKESWKQSDLPTYLDFYAPEFQKTNGMDMDEFKRYKKIIFERNEEKKIIFSDINIMPYPNEKNKNMFRILMHEDYKTKNYQFNGKKELFIELVDNKMKILTES